MLKAKAFKEIVGEPLKTEGFEYAEKAQGEEGMRKRCNVYG